MVKGIWENIPKFIRNLDQFGASFSFKYKSEEKYLTYSGGIICLLFYIVSLIFFIWNLIPFLNKEIFTLHFYTLYLQNYDEIRLNDSKTTFAFSLNCPSYIKTKEIRELFDLKFNYMNQTIYKGDKFVNTVTEIKLRKCKQEDFYDHHNKGYTLLNISDLECIDPNELNDHQLKGIFGYPEFTYYRITVSSKNKSETFFKKINNLLFQNDCKLKFYYTDISTDLSDFKEPIKPYINSLSF